MFRSAFRLSSIMFNFAFAMGRLLAIDYGTKRTGIAVSDPLRIIATALDTVATGELHAWLAKYFAAEAVDIIVVGKPLQPGGAPSATYPHALGLARRLEKDYPDKKVVMFDERYTSVMAMQSMIDSGVRKMDRRDKAAVDKVSAAILLQGFMESKMYNEII